MSYLVQMNEDERDTAPLINDLEITEIFKDKAEEEEVSVTDLIN